MLTSRFPVARAGRVRVPALLVLSVGLVVACTARLQTPDYSFVPEVPRPEFAPGEGPRVLIDETHCNFHTAGGRFAPFAALLRGDGLVVSSLRSSISPATLAEADLLVIANPMPVDGCDEYDLPTASAFSADEIVTITDWVEAGGALLLIADHMPFAGAAADLGDAFGLMFINGYARPPAGGPIRFDRATGTLGDHPITAGRDSEEAVDHVLTFTGQGFRARTPVTEILTIPPGITLFMPPKHGRFHERTPSFPAEGLLQGVVLTAGLGRVAVFGEAGMFSAQTVIVDDVRRDVGMSAPEADQNARFVLNLVRWLLGALDAAAPTTPASTR